MGFADEKQLVLIAMIFGLFIMTTLSGTVGAIFFGMSVVYAVAINQGTSNVYEFVRGKVDYFRIGAIGAVFVGLWYLASKNLLSVFDPFQLYSSSFTIQFTLEDPIIKFIVFTLFVGIVETLFFLGVVQKFLIKRANARERLNDPNTLIAIAITAAIVGLFHVKAALFDEKVLLVDFLFFALSGILVIVDKLQLITAAVIHIAANGVIMAKILNWITFSLVM